MLLRAELTRISEPFSEPPRDLKTRFALVLLGPSATADFFLVQASPDHSTSGGLISLVTRGSFPVALESQAQIQTSNEIPRIWRGSLNSDFGGAP